MACSESSRCVPSVVSVVWLLLALCCCPLEILSQVHAQPSRNTYAGPQTHPSAPRYDSWGRRIGPNYRQSYPSGAIPPPHYGHFAPTPIPAQGAGGWTREASHNLYKSIPELDKPAFLRNPRQINIQAVRTRWQPNFVVPLPPGQLMAASLYPGVGQNFSLPVKLDGNMAITVHPRRGFTTFNVTYMDVELMVHPYFNSKIRQVIDVGNHQPVQAMPVSHGAFHRRKRCCISGAARANSGMDVPSLDAGLGMSLGPGSLTYFKEDVAGGLYNLTTLNRGAGMSEIVVFTTLNPEFSPFPRMHGTDPQIKVQEIRATSVKMSWEALTDAPEVVYCFIYHRAQDHYPDDVHSSSYAAWIERDTAVHLQCVKSGPDKQNTMIIPNLQPGTEYHIDLLSHNRRTSRETTYMGVQVRTAGGLFGGGTGPARGFNSGATGAFVGVGRTPPFAGPSFSRHPGRSAVVAPGRFRDHFGRVLPPGHNSFHSPQHPGSPQRQPKMPVDSHGVFYNPANPRRPTVSPPSTPPPPMKAFTPRAPNSARQPWYYNFIHNAKPGSQQVGRYHAPPQWANPGPGSRPRTHRDVGEVLWLHAADQSSSSRRNHSPSMAVLLVFPLVFIFLFLAADR